VFERVPYIDYDLLIVDEASMVTQDIFVDMRSYGIPMLFVGDHGQLPPISQDDFNLMSNPVVKLEEVHRFGNGSSLLDLSIMARNGDAIPFKRFDEKVAKVSVVGAGMESHPNIAAQVFEALYNANINIRMISTSEIKISVLIDQEFADLAVRVLHDKFFSPDFNA
jgi:ATP-dependent exoDNAse (exonuclease V) alpha subunit